MPQTGKIPVAYQTDVIVAGGSVAGVAAAVAAARAGSRVFLAASETYLGEDICAPGRLWLSREEALRDPLVSAVFADAVPPHQGPARPMQIKRRLEDMLLEANVTFLFGCAPADLLADSSGKVAGVAFACKTGLFAVLGRVAIDATLHAVLARVAGAPFTAWPGGDVRFKCVAVGHRAGNDQGNAGKRLPGMMRGQIGGDVVEVEAFEYEFVLPVGDLSPGAWMEAEHTIRDRVWHKEQTWSFDRSWHVPPVALDVGSLRNEADPLSVPIEAMATPREGLFVLGPCAAFTRAAAELLMEAPSAMMLGARLGRHAAGKACGAEKNIGRVWALNAKASDSGVLEPCTCDRFLRQSERFLSGGAGGNLPEFGSFDVVVAGGGTAGAPAAIAAARAGARVLVLESLAGLGGVGTLGCISIYYHGYRGGFTQEVTDGLKQLSGAADFQPHKWNSEHKAEWLRRAIREAGGTIWYACLVSGALREGRNVRGVVVNTLWGRGIVRAGVVADATGNADVVAAAGGECRVASDSDLAIQGAGLPSRPFKPGCNNSDYTFIEDGDPTDVTRAFALARRKFAADFDLAPLPDTRERRRIVGDVEVTPLDVYTGRTWRDTICLSRSNFDSHGFTAHPLFLIEPPDRVGLDAWLPLRALLPKRLNGVLALGLSLSAHRDVMPVLRMQADVQNHAYAAGLAAAEAAMKTSGDIRKIDTRALQRALAAKGIIPQSALLHEDARKLSVATIKSAASGNLLLHAESAALLLNSGRAAGLLRGEFARETNRERRGRCARLLAVMGDAAGEDALIEEFESAGAWDEGWNYTGMGQFGRSLSPMDDAMVCLGLIKSEKARRAVIAKIRLLDADHAFSHFRAAALYAEAVGGADLAAAVAGVLEKPAIKGHAWICLSDEFAAIPQSKVDNISRNEALRELYLARALYRCGDVAGLGARILENYSRDIRGHFARHSARALAAGA